MPKKSASTSSPAAWQGILCNVLVGFVIVAHTALTLIDVVGMMNLADFMIRPDGSQQDPNHMLPVEKVLVTMIAFPFWTVLVAFAVADRPTAAILGAVIQGSYAMLQLVNWDTWQALFHPDTDLSMEFFVYTKGVWIVVFGIIWYLSSQQTSEKSQGELRP